MKDTFEVLEINRYKLLDGLKVGIDYSEVSDVVTWNLVCIGTNLSKLSEYLKSKSVDNIYINGDKDDVITVQLRLPNKIKQFAGSYITEELSKLYDEFYCMIKDYLQVRGKENDN